MFDKLAVLYKSDPLPPLGLMMVETQKTKKHKQKVTDAVLKMCHTKEGEPVCQNFGLIGFEAINPGVVKDVVERYESRSK